MCAYIAGVFASGAGRWQPSVAPLLVGAITAILHPITLPVLSDAFVIGGALKLAIAACWPCCSIINTCGRAVA